MEHLKFRSRAGCQKSQPQFRYSTTLLVFQIPVSLMFQSITWHCFVRDKHDDKDKQDGKKLAYFFYKTTKISALFLSSQSSLLLLQFLQHNRTCMEFILNYRPLFGSSKKAILVGVQGTAVCMTSNGEPPLEAQLALSVSVP